MADLSDKIHQALQCAREGRLEQARSGLERVLQKQPNNADANASMGYVLAQMGRGQQALFYARRAAKSRPDEPGLLFNQGMLAIQSGENAEGIEALTRVLAIQPENIEARASLVWALWTESRYVSAADAARAGLMLHPGDPRLTLGLAGALRGLGRADESVGAVREAIRANPRHLPLRSILAFTLNYVRGAGAEEILAAHTEYAEMVREVFAPLPAAAERPRDPERRLRLGILSGEIVTHPVAFFLEPLLRNIDRETFDVAIYYTALNEDKTTERLKGYASIYRNAPGTDIAALDRTIRGDSIDILLELTGHTGFHRLPVLAMRPAPVQVAWLGYPNTTGLREVGHRIVDSLTDPDGAEARAVEALVRLDPCFLCYAPAAERPDAARAPRSGGQGVTFVSFNVLTKVNEGVIALWARIMGAVEGSRLMLKDDAFKEAEARVFVRERFEKHGIAGDRIETLARTASLRDHLALYNSADIALDPFPYNGTTTTCDALLMGVPTVTLAGSMHAGRVGVSLLTNVGLGEMIAKTEDEYFRIATTLAADGARLAELRRTLRDRLLNSPLCDETGFTRRFEGALREMWRAHCRGAGGTA